MRSTWSGPRRTVMHGASLPSETERARALFELAIDQPALDMSELLWKFIDKTTREVHRQKERELVSTLPMKGKFRLILKEYSTSALGGVAAFLEHVFVLGLEMLLELLRRTSELGVPHTDVLVAAESVFLLIEFNGFSHGIKWEVAAGALVLVVLGGASFVSFVRSDDDDDDHDEEAEEKEPDCPWCEKKMSLGPCAANYCCDLPFDTMREAVEFYKQKNTFGCHKHVGVGNAKFARSPEKLEQHFKAKHKDMFKKGCNPSKCACGAFFENKSELPFHRQCRDKLRCYHKPGENLEARKTRISDTLRQAHKVDQPLRDMGY
ncbi:Crooked neck-like protein 1 [Castilleja foliolosa]|uniref:Crooked neck-like protein 1 n=1 Tax=Castilleja foliolosa TaxID=1961234 RepID=A0ABD3E0Z2_9LAMI